MIDHRMDYSKNLQLNHLAIERSNIIGRWYPLDDGTLICASIGPFNPTPWLENERFDVLEISTHAAIIRDLDQ